MRESLGLEDVVVEAALKLSAEKGWHATNLWDIAKRANVPFAELYSIAPSKRAVEDVFSRRIDSQALSDLEPSDSCQPTRDRIFDVMMLRLEAMEPYKEGLRSIYKAAAIDPFAGLRGLSSLIRSMAAVLEVSGIDSGDFLGGIRARVLALIWLRTFQIWLDDDGDLSKTMAHLDRQLRRVERLANSFENTSSSESRSSAADGKSELD